MAGADRPHCQDAVLVGPPLGEVREVFEYLAGVGVKGPYLYKDARRVVVIIGISANMGTRVKLSGF